MPTRLIREGLLDSERIFRAGEAAEILFTRLMLVADDYGRYDGRVSVICRRCWPIGGPTEPEVLVRLTALTECGLVVTYEVDGKPFILIPNFKQRLRVKNPSKFPDPPPVSHLPDARPAVVSHPPVTCSLEARSEKREVEARSEKREAHAVPQDSTSAVSAGTAAAAAFAGIPPEPLSLEEARIDSDALTPAGHLSAVCVANGLKATPFNPLVIEWGMRGISVAKLKDAIATARQRKPEPQSIPLAYLNTILLDEGPPKGDTRWAIDEDACREKAKELGLWPPSGKDNSWEGLRQRIREALRGQAREQVH